MAKISIDPVTRIEGHLKVEVEVEGGKVTDAKCSGTMFRGFEIIMKGRDPRDAQHLTQRICGVCPQSHALAASLNLEEAFGVEPPENARIMRNLVQGANYVMSHILHFYHLAALDYVKGPETAPFIPRDEGDYRLPQNVNDAAVEHYLQALDIRRKCQEMLTIFGGKRHGTRGRGAEGKTAVVGAVERDGRVIARVVPDVKRHTLVPFMNRRVHRNATLYTDTFPSYDHMTRIGYRHLRIEHQAKEYARGSVHTNTIEGFWSLLKRGIGGVYHSVSAKYLQSYINEYGFRYNHRKDESPMFLTVLRRV